MWLVVQLVTVTVCSVLVLLLVLWSWIYWKNRAVIKVASSLPALTNTLPFLGHAHLALLGHEGLTQKLTSFITEAVGNGVHTFCLWIGPIPYVFITAREDVKKILSSSSTLDKASLYESFDLLWKDGLLTASGSVWKKTSRYIHPLFHARNVEKLIPTFNKNSRELVSILSEHVDAGPVNVFRYIMDTALQSACNLIYGSEFHIDTKSTEFRSLMRAMKRYPKLVGRRTYNLWLMNDRLFNFLHAVDITEFKKGFTGLTHIYRKIKTCHNSSESKCNSQAMQLGEWEETGSDNLFHFYETLQKHFPYFTDEKLDAEINSILSAGTDTIATNVSSCLLVLAYHQEVQEKVYEEISLVLAERDDVTTGDIKKMTYLDQVYKETLRWTNVIPLVARKLSTKLHLRSCCLPAGSTVALNLLGIHMDPSVYEDPQKFNPERFSPERSHDKEKYSFLPFSGGPRGCVGKFYAEMQIKTILTHVLKRFKLTTPTDIYNLKKKISVALICSEGYYIRFLDRNK